MESLKNSIITEKPPDLTSESVEEKGGFGGEKPARRCRSTLFFMHGFPIANIPIARKITFSLRKLPWGRILKKMWRRKEKEQVVSAASKTLLRMAATRRIVTSLGRLLASKGDVIAQIRKRMHTTSPEVASAGLGRAEVDGEIAIYMGDIQGEFNSDHPHDT